jgi:large subunit ribosomal protein L24
MKDEVQMGCPSYKRNDVVQVISGKYKGKSGKVLRVLRDKNRIIVEKINIIKRHTKPTQTDPQGGIIEKEAPFHVSKVLPVSTKTGKPMRFALWLRENPRALKGQSVEGEPAKKAKKASAGAKKKGAK